MNMIEEAKTWDKEPPEMVKKVAEALKAQCLKEFGSTWDYDTTWNFARAAIEAMREPTDDMCFSGRDVMNYRDTQREGPQETKLLKDAEEFYKTMINKALEET